MNNIPVEIILHVGHSFIRHDLFQLVLVSKSFYALFIPQLYYQVRLPLNHYDDWGFRDPSLNDLPVRRFSQAIIENPTLAILVHSLYLYPHECNGEKWRGRSPLRELPEEKLQASLFPNGKSKRKYWRKYQAWRNDLRDRPTQKPERLRENAWLGLLLLQLQNLEQLTIWRPEERSIYEPYERETVFLDRVIHWARDPKLGILTRLTHLYIREGPIWQGMGGVEDVPVDRIIPYLRIPSLRALHVLHLFERPGPALPAKDLFLTHINVQGINENNLGVYSPLKSLPKLLSLCSRLESFTWRPHDCYLDHEHPSKHDFTNPCSFYTPLRRSRETLRELNIALEIHHGEETRQNAQVPRPRFLGSLSDFLVLETINMRLSNVMYFHERTHVPIVPLWEVLPRSLRVLYIRDCLVQSSSMLYHELETLAAHVSTDFPHLQKLGIHFATREAEPGSGCWTCAGHIPKTIDEGGYVVDEGIELLKGRFRELHVDFLVMPRGQALPFPCLWDHFADKDYPA